MSELAYLGLAFFASIIGSGIVIARQRQPQSLESGVQRFSKAMNALEGAPIGVARPRESRPAASKKRRSRLAVGEWS